jgi:NADPH-dependent 2,4-dienoyl-CoA reductase/sulfur reductase-like enzyme
VSHYDVVILGAGPAGLAAAARLAALGIKDIVVLDRENQPGGVPRHCGHVAFGLREFHRPLSGPAYAKRLAGTAAGIDIRTRTTVTAIEPGGRVHAIHPDSGPASFSGRAVLIAFGVRETPRSTRLVSGDRPIGVTTTGALQQFVYLSRIRPFGRAVVVGSELVAFSALLTLRHGGIEAAAMIEEGPRITARRPADWVAGLALGVPVLTGTKLLAIRGLERVEAVEIEGDGRRWTIACDGVVFTGRFRPETAILAGSHLEIDPGSGGPAIDQHWRCSDPAFFAAGNLLRPVETAGVAWAEGRAAADAIAAFLAGALPPTASTATVKVAAPLKYVYPQRFSLPAGRISPLLFKLRTARAAKGNLRLVGDGHELWSRRMTILPERRLSLPLSRIPRAALTSLSVEFEET